LEIEYRIEVSRVKDVIEDLASLFAVTW